MRDFQEPSLPLPTEQFRHALHAGLGRARMHLEALGLTPELRDIVLAASTSCKVFDPQCEDLPARWFADFCEGADIVSTLLSQKPGEEYWDQAWCFALRKEFARRDYPGAKDALYDTLVETATGDLLGAEDLVAFDGADGLLHVANRLGSMWSENPPLTPDDGPLAEFDDSHAEGAALALLTDAAASNSNIAFYLRVLSSRAPVGPPALQPPPTLAETIEAIAAATECKPGLTFRARNFTADEIAPIRRLATSTSNEVVLENCLRALSQSKNLLFDEALVPFLRHASYNVRFFAARALSVDASEGVADLARGFLHSDLVVALTLLRRSARPSDLEPILASLVVPSDSGTAHDVVGALLNAINDSSLPLDPRLLIFVYEVTPCQNCRLSSVEFLLESDDCPRWLRHEAQFDACDEIRELVGRVSTTT